MTPTEGKLISQEALQTTFQLHTATSIKESTKHPITWPTLSQPFITPIITSVQPQKELLQWHHRLGHMGFKKIQYLMRTGVFANTEATNSLHTSAWKLLPTPFVQHVSLENRDKGHLQAREAQWSRMFKAT